MINEAAAVAKRLVQLANEHGTQSDYIGAQKLERFIDSVILARAIAADTVAHAERKIGQIVATLDAASEEIS